MTRQSHLQNCDRERARQQRRGAADLALQVQQHIVECCPDCEAEWQRLGPLLRSAYLDCLDALRTAEEPTRPPLDHLSGTPEALESDEAALRDAQRLRHRALEEKGELVLRTPPGQRLDKIARARLRFRSLALSEMLIEECRRRVRNQPAAARAIVELVPHVLVWTRERTAPERAKVLLARAEAHRANALRVAGDLPAAERVFLALRRTLARRPLAEPGAVAEIASLEASLCIGQRRFPEAEKLLNEATLAACQAGDLDTLARVHIKQANLKRVSGRPADVAPLWESAARLLDPAAEPFLYLCTVTGRVNALCDLDRPADAQRLLMDNLDAYESSEDPFAGAIFRCLQGRCALGLGDLGAAEQAFTASREAHLTLGRAYDAALDSLFLAETLFLAGKTRPLRQLAAGLAAFFRSRGVDGEALAALQLFSRAVATEALSAALFADLRRRLGTASGAPHPA